MSRYFVYLFDFIFHFARLVSASCCSLHSIRFWHQFFKLGYLFPASGGVHGFSILALLSDCSVCHLWQWEGSESMALQTKCHEIAAISSVLFIWWNCDGFSWALTDLFFSLPIFIQKRNAWHKFTFAFNGRSYCARRCDANNFNALSPQYTRHINFHPVLLRWRTPFIMAFSQRKTVNMQRQMVCRISCRASACHANERERERGRSEKRIN